MTPGAVERYRRCYRTTVHLLGFALQKLRGSLRRIPAMHAVFSKDLVNAYETCRRRNCRICGFEPARYR